MPGCALHPLLTAPVPNLLILSIPVDVPAVLEGSSLGLAAFVPYKSSGSNMEPAVKQRRPGRSICWFPDMRSSFLLGFNKKETWAVC